MQELDHEPSKALEGARYPDCRADLDENSSCSMNIDLQLPGFVRRRIEEGEETLANSQ